MISSTYRSAYRSPSNAGFSLIELLVVLLMVGILATIAIPSWLNYVNQQRVNKANEAILAALQEAQSKAKKTKLSYSASVRINNQGTVETAVYPVTESPDRYWQQLGGDLRIPAGSISVSTNVTQPNKAGASFDVGNYDSGTKSQTITFDYRGTLPGADFGAVAADLTEQPGLRFVVKSNNLKRCVVVQTLIGGMRTNRDSNCDYPN